MDSYLNFDLRVSRGATSECVLEVTSSPLGETATAASTVDIHALERRLRAISGPGARSADRGFRFGVCTAEVTETETAESAGRKLFESFIFSEVAQLYRKSLFAAQEKKMGLRVRLCIDAPDLAILPWEYLFDDSDGDFVALSKRTPVTRFREIGRPPPQPVAEPRIRILGMVASPTDLPALDVEQEKRQIEAALAGRISEGEITLKWLPGQTWRDLQHAMRKEHWNVFHFIGHGDFRNDEGLLALADEAGKAQLITATQFGRLLADHDSLQLAVINSCRGASASEKDLYSSTGTVLLRRGVPAVISMQYEISDKAAIEFSRTFYDVLADNEPVDKALTEARIAISNVPDTGGEWATPVLHMRSMDGILFTPNVASEIFTSAPDTRATPTTATRALAESADAGIAKGLEIFVAKAKSLWIYSRLGKTNKKTAEEAIIGKGLEVLAAKVKNYWIDGVLSESIHKAAQIDLGLESTQGVVDGPWRGLIEQVGHASRVVPEGQSPGQVFDELGGSLLILGEPGSGKTIAMLQLARELLDRFATGRTLAVPVVFNLSSWSTTRLEFGRWLEDEMVSKYQVPFKVARLWLKTNRVTPLLDGLDEVNGEARSACVRAINALDHQTAMSIVVCSRLKEYLALPEKLSLSAALRLRRLSKEQVMHYVQRGGERLRGLAFVLEHEPALLIEARTPLMLSMMIRAYRDAPADTIRTQGIEQLITRRRQLMEDFVRERFALTRRSAGGA